MAEYTCQGNAVSASTYTQTGARTQGTQFDVGSTPVWLTHIRFYRNTVSVTGPTSFGVWKDDGTLVAGVTAGNAGSLTGWIEWPLSTPISLPAGRYRVGAYFASGGTLPGTTQWWSTGGGANGMGTPGVLFAPNATNATGNGQGCTSPNTTATRQFPSAAAANRTNYWVDVKVTDVNPFIEPKNIAGSTRSVSSTVSRGTARKRLRAAVSSVSQALGRGLGRRRGSGGALSRSATAGVAKGKHFGRGATASRSATVGRGQRGRTFGSGWPVRSLTATSGGGRARLFGGGSTTSYSAIRGGGGIVAGGETSSVSRTAGGGYVRVHGAGVVRSSTETGLGEHTAKHWNRGRTSSTSRTSGRARGRRYCIRSATRSVSRTSGAGLVRIIGAAGIARPHVGMSIRLFDSNGTVSDYAPDWRGISFTDVYNESGTVVIDYAKQGVNAARLKADRTEGALFDGSIEIPGTRFLVTQQATDGVNDDASGQTISINAPLWVPARLEEAKVYPPGYPKRNEITKTQFNAATPGHIIGTLIAQAKNRGAISNVVQGFTAAVDSRGLPWKTKVSLEVEMGVSVMSVIGTLVEMDVLDWTTQGRELVLRNSDSGVDRTVGDNPLVLQAGRDMLDAPEKRDVTEFYTVMLVEGEEGLWVEVRNETAYAARGRYEGFISASGVKDEGTLRVIGQAALARANLPKTENTHALSLFSYDGPQPWLDYQVGDYLFRSTGKGTVPERLRVSQLSFSVGEDGTASSSITLGDRFETTDIKLKRRIDALTRGSTGNSAPAESPDDDRVPPEVPTGLLVNSDAYIIEGGDGNVSAAVMATWNPVVRSKDGSPISDLDRYEVRWREVRPSG